MQTILVRLAARLILVEASKKKHMVGILSHWTIVRYLRMCSPFVTAT